MIDWITRKTQIRNCIKRLTKLDPKENDLENERGGGCICETHSGELVTGITNEHTSLAHSSISNSHTFYKL